MEKLSAWVEQAAKLPVAFAQVREDPLLDQWVVEQLRPNADAMMVASGGCTAAVLAANSHVGRLHLVDPNPAQLALTRLKLWLLQNADRDERMAVLGHSTMPNSERATRIEAILTVLELPLDVLGELSFVAEVGPDHCGRYERLFFALRDELIDCRVELHDALCLENISQQEKLTNNASQLGHRLREALDSVMSLPILVRLFGIEATNNPAQPFARHFLWRIQHAFWTLPARTNPYLWQMLRGTYPDGYVVPWLEAKRTTHLAAITWTDARMDHALETSEQSFDFIHLSNILDWLAPQEAQRTLDLAWQALRPGGRILLRQLNSTLDVPAVGPQFEWLESDADTLHRNDRSFFYRRLHLGAKR